MDPQWTLSDVAKRVSEYIAEKGPDFKLKFGGKMMTDLFVGKDGEFNPVIDIPDSDPE